MALKKQNKSDEEFAAEESHDEKHLEVKVKDTSKSGEQVLDITQSQPPPSDLTEPTNETVRRKSGGPRSVCAMYKVQTTKAKGKKIKVTFNARGMPNGCRRHTLQSYIGVVARQMIPIDVSTWPKVDKEYKQNLWKDIQNTFRVPAQSEALVLKSAGVKWRQFKTTLTTKYVLPFLGQKKKLLRPPKQYSFVGRDTWKKFVQQRVGEKWQPLHKNQSERVRKRKYHHRLSRKGYIGLEEEQIKRGELDAGEEPDRAILWKKARKPKGDPMDVDLLNIHEKIDDLLEKQQMGEFKPSGCEDVLTVALETPEHSGRVRGVGGFISPTVYFNLPKERRVRITKSELLARDRQRSEEFDKRTNDLMSEIAQLKEMIKAGKNFTSPMCTENVSVGHDQVDNGVASILTDLKKASFPKQLSAHEEDDCMLFDSPPPFDENVKDTHSCELAVGSIDNKVAFGMAFLHEEDMNVKIHGVDIPPGCLRVSVDGILKPDAELPIRGHDKMRLVNQALGSHVAWPKNLVIFNKPVVKKKATIRKTPVQRQSLFSKTLPKCMPNRFRLLYKHATTHMKDTGESIQIPADLEVFGVEKTIFLLHENILALLEFEMVGQAAIATYMMYLHTVIRKNEELDTFAFVDPSATYKLNDDFEQYLVNRLNEGSYDRMFFLPHNHNDHWILAIIWEDEIYILNPLPHPIHFPDLEKALISAVKSFNAQTGRGKKIPKVKNLSGSPKQPGGHECGYVVMRYMKDIIDDKQLTFATKWMTKTRNCYSREDLDEVRFQTLDYIQDHML